MFAMFLTGCTVTTHQMKTFVDHEINPEFYSEITPISKTEDGVCAISEFYDENLGDFDNIVDIQAEENRTTMGFSEKSGKAAKAPKKKAKKKVVEDDEEEEEDEEDDE